MFLDCQGSPRTVGVHGALSFSAIVLVPTGFRTPSQRSSAELCPRWHIVYPSVSQSASIQTRTLHSDSFSHTENPTSSHTHVVSSPAHLLKHAAHLTHRRSGESSLATVVRATLISAPRVKKQLVGFICLIRLLLRQVRSNVVGHCI